MLREFHGKIECSIRYMIKVLLHIKELSMVPWILQMIQKGSEHAKDMVIVIFC